MNPFSTAEEKWQLQHLGNYFHTERSLAGVRLYFGCVCFGLLLTQGHRYRTWFMTASSVQTSCCPWLNTEFPSLSHTPSHTSRRINAHTQTSQTCKYYLGIFCSCHLGFGLHNHIHRHAQKQHMSGKGFGHILGIIKKKLKNNLCTLPNQFKHVRTLWVWSTHRCKTHAHA